MNDKSYLNYMVISMAIIVSSLILACAWVSGKTPMHNITVTGSASTDFSSDLIVWKASFSKKAMTSKDAYDALKQDAENIRKYLHGKGVSEKELIFSSVNIQKNFRDEAAGRNGDVTIKVFDGYTLTQNVSIESHEIDKIEKISREITDLIDLNIELSSEAPQYYYTKLSELKIAMLAKATADGKLRAKQIAENAGSSLGGLKSADMGIFQITGQNSSEDYSYGGAYNTNSKNKTASITTHLEFGIR